MEAARAGRHDNDGNLMLIDDPSHIEAHHYHQHHYHHDDDHHHDAHQHATPFARLRKLIWEDKSDLVAILIYTLMTGVLTLAIPLSAQALVNTIAAGVFIQPLVTLTLIVFGCLIFAGVLRLLKLALIERMQQRIFARVALRLATRLPRISHRALTGKYAPELVNRFFDVLTVQKTLSKLLLDAPSALLQVFIGLTLLALYSPYLLAFDLMVVVFVLLVIWVLGLGALNSSIDESVQKYRVAQWLEEVGRCQTGFKTAGDAAYPVERTDNLVVGYITARRAHFRVLFRQSVGHFLFRAVASAGILAVGGWLVINRQLTLGQLVAANIIVVSILAALEKLISQLEQLYDLLTALDKIGHLTDLPLERADGRRLNARADTAGASVQMRGVRFSYRAHTEVLAGLNLNVAAGARISIVGKSGAGKSTLAAMLSGVLEPSHGTVLVNNMEVREANLQSLRRMVANVSDTNEIFEGTVEENILLGRGGYISHEDLRWALEMTQLSEELAVFPEGIKTRLTSEGRNISRGQAQRLLVARAIVGRPQLLILDEAFTGIDERDKLNILDEIYRNEHRWTIIDISHDPEVVTRSSVIYVLEGGRIVEQGALGDLRSGKDNFFTTLFPSLKFNPAG